jgi:predicted ABC-type transport system involved in lysophospholipase L1 biosynthesis ATPase subunit
MRQYVAVISGAGEHPPDDSARDASGVAVRLTGVIVRSGALVAAGISLHIPAGQSVALHSHVDGTAVDMLDVVAGLRRPRSGQVLVGGVEVDRLSGAAMERYRANRGLLSQRFPLLSSLSVTDNVLAASRSRRADARARERAAELLVLTGAGHLASAPVEALTAEQQWRILVARALLPVPRLVLAEDPTPILKPRSAARILDLLMDAHGRYGFTLLLATDRLATAARCRRLVTLAGASVTADELSSDDDPWTRGRVDRIG